MSAYVISDITVNNHERYEDYKKLAPPTIHNYSGKYLARGGRVEKLEGNWDPDRIVILEFESREARALRHQNASTNMIVV